MNQCDGDRSFADSRRHALDVPSPNITDRKYARATRFEQVGWPRQRPGGCRQVLGSEAGTSLHESVGVESNTSVQPARVRSGSRHQENVTDAMNLGLAGLVVAPGDTLQFVVPLERHDFSVRMHDDRRVVIDPANQLTDLQRRRYYDVVLDLHEMQKKGTEIANALTPVQAQLTEIEGKAASLPPDIKAQFDAVNTEWAVVREKWGVGGAAAPAGGGGRGGPPPNPNNVLGRAGTVKTGMMSFYDVPSDSLAKGYTDVKAAMPKAIAETNAWLTKATALSNSLKKMNLTLTVPAPIK